MSARHISTIPKTPVCKTAVKEIIYIYIERERERPIENKTIHMIVHIII